MPLRNCIWGKVVHFLVFFSTRSVAESRQRFITRDLSIMGDQSQPTPFIHEDNDTTNSLVLLPQIPLSHFYSTHEIWGLKVHIVS